MPGDCEVYIPSAFTPNNDNLNETFGVVDNTTLQYFSFQIYSKWGQLIFNSNDVTQKWDGTFKGKKNTKRFLFVDVKLYKIPRKKIL